MAVSSFTATAVQHELLKLSSFFLFLLRSRKWAMYQGRVEFNLTVATPH